VLAAPESDPEWMLGAQITDDGRSGPLPWCCASSHRPHSPAIAWQDMGPTFDQQSVARQRGQVWHERPPVSPGTCSSQSAAAASPPTSCGTWIWTHCPAALTGPWT
jgi:hypothetical protein